MSTEEIIMFLGGRFDHRRLPVPASGRLIACRANQPNHLYVRDGAFMRFAGICDEKGNLLIPAAEMRFRSDYEELPDGVKDVIMDELCQAMLWCDRDVRRAGEHVKKIAKIFDDSGYEIGIYNRSVI